MVTASVSYRWKLLRSFRGGHRYFIDENTNRMAVADQSGRLPELTSDGVLWLDPHLPIQAGHGYMLPLVDEGNCATATPITDEEADWLAFDLGYDVKIGRTICTAKRP